MSRPHGTRKPYSLTAQDRRRIVAQTRHGKTQLELAREFGVCVDTIRRIQKAAGLGRWRPVDADMERKICELARAGVGQYRTAKILRVSQPKVHAVLKKNGLVLPAGDPGRVRIPPRVLAEFIEGVRQRRDTIAALSRKAGISRWIGGKIAHAVLGPAPIKNYKQPLTSDFPQSDALLPTDIAIELVSRHFVGGKFPFGREHDPKFAAAILSTVRTSNPHARDEHVEVWRAEIAGAVADLRLAQETAAAGLVH